ncbi:hypothetical protein BJ741DRAFT_585153 [Chytriomyces cf. hyalinus JEL632]|nr:hypothetical protein BJ741DRAFT_585153 [Chytriomyces cf. hyalinus JEL632]
MLRRDVCETAVSRMTRLILLFVCPDAKVKSAKKYSLGAYKIKCAEMGCELEARKMKCNDLDWELGTGKIRYDGATRTLGEYKSERVEMESELRAYKKTGPEMQKRAEDSAAAFEWVFQNKLSNSNKHAEEVSRLISQVEFRNGCLTLMGRERTASAVRERELTEGIAMLTMNLMVLMTSEEERSQKLLESMAALFSSDLLDSIIAATSGGYFLAYMRTNSLLYNAVQRSKAIAQPQTWTANTKE